MELFTIENITISHDWLTPIGVALVLLAFYWFRHRLELILKIAAVVVLVFSLASLGYLLSVCYGAGYDGPVWEWTYLGVDHWTAFSTIESCMSSEVSTVVGVDRVHLWWNMPTLGVLLWWLGHLLNRQRIWKSRFDRAERKRRRYTGAEIRDIRDKARRRL